MEKCLLSTAYLGPVEYFYFLLKSTESQIELHETFAKQSYRNRCNIYGANGMQTLSIPVKASNHTITKDVLIDNSVPWQKQHWKSISSAYGSAPFYIYYDYELLPIFQQQFKFLIDFNQALLNKILNFLKSNPVILPTTEFSINDPEIIDFRNSIHPKKKQILEKQEYPQVFYDKHGFINNLSIIDLIFNLGPEAKGYIADIDSFKAFNY
ncbi:MAG: WbqC family protein [Bacteroidetes bacterium]|nr:WbqC family protein [Bacteroidota bacterium]